MTFLLMAWVTAHACISGAYACIPIQLFLYLRGLAIPRDLAIIQYLFISFIAACGLTHLHTAIYCTTHSVAGIDSPSNSVVAVSLASLCGVVSILTAFFLAKALPRILQLPKENIEMRQMLKQSDKNQVALKHRADVMQTERNNAAILLDTQKTFLCSVSHELRSPLNAVIGFSSLLAMADLTDDQREMVDQIFSSSNFLLTVINDMLDMGKYERGDFKLEECPFSIDDCVEKVVASVSPMAMAAHIYLHGDIDPDVPKVLVGDVVRYTQVLTNLVSNAVKFTPTGGVTIHLSIERIDPVCLTPASLRGSIVIDMADTSNTDSEHDRLLDSDSLNQYCDSPDYTNWGLVMRVKDTGIGVSDKGQTHLFKPFSQADESTTRKFGGTGLGLSICRLLVDKMGGRIGVNSKVGRGSTFFCHLPITVPPPENSSMGSLIEVQGAGPIDVVATHKKALDDHIRRKLVREGYTVSVMQTLAECRGSMAVVHHHRDCLDDLRNYLSVLPEPRCPTKRRRVLLIMDGTRNTSEPRSCEVDKLMTEFPACVHFAYVPLTRRQLVAFANPDRPRVPPKFVGSPVTHDRYRKLRILVVDDLMVNRKIIRRLLASLDVNDITDASNGLECINRSDLASFDLIFMDLQMPVMDGLEATHRIRDMYPASLPEGPKHIVALSADLEIAHVADARKDMFDEYMTKPITRDVLRDCLHRCTAKSHNML